jgi:uncharacterized SAM-dependent methyltransferase
MHPCSSTTAVRFYDYCPSTATIHEKILRGLRQRKKELPSFLLYDARGIRLFDRIGRTGNHSTADHERRLLERCRHPLRRHLSSRLSVVEYGSGTSRTAMTLLRTLPGVAVYMPVDLSLSSLKFGVRRVRWTFAGLRVVPVRADFTTCFAVPRSAIRSAGTLVYLSSCAFGTMDSASVTKLLQGAANFCGPRGAILLGVDLRTNGRDLARTSGDDALLERFNLNALEHLNRRYSANFHLDRFRHAVVFDEARRRTELRLFSQVDQTVKIDEVKLRLRRGESILTESRQQYRWQELESLASDAGTLIERAWFDDDRNLALIHLRPVC